jgi:hypothetical protein
MNSNVNGSLPSDQVEILQFPLGSKFIVKTDNLRKYQHNLEVDSLLQRYTNFQF